MTGVVIDSSIWSLALRRKAPSARAAEMIKRLVAEDRALIFGAIRQEVLSGIRHVEQFERLRDRLRVFPDLRLEQADYELAAEFFNRCRSQGIQGSNTDLLICAVAYRRQADILTADRDFQLFSAVIPVVLMDWAG